MAEGDTLVNAVIGAVVGTVLGPIIPFAPVVGGAVSGYVQGGDRSEGLRVGAISGVIAFLPYVLVGALVFLVLTTFVLGVGVGPGEFLGVGALSGVVVVVALVGLAVYVVGLSTLGGWIGNYVKYETSIGD